MGEIYIDWAPNINVKSRVASGVDLMANFFHGVNAGPWRRPEKAEKGSVRQVGERNSLPEWVQDGIEEFLKGNHALPWRKSKGKWGCQQRRGFRREQPGELNLGVDGGYRNEVCQRKESEEGFRR